MRFRDLEFSINAPAFVKRYPVLVRRAHTAGVVNPIDEIPTHWLRPELKDEDDDATAENAMAGERHVCSLDLIVVSRDVAGNPMVEIMDPAEHARHLVWPDGEGKPLLAQPAPSAEVMDAAVRETAAALQTMGHTVHGTMVDGSKAILDIDGQQAAYVYHPGAERLVSLHQQHEMIYSGPILRAYRAIEPGNIEVPNPPTAKNTPFTTTHALQPGDAVLADNLGQYAGIENAQTFIGRYSRTRALPDPDTGVPTIITSQAAMPHMQAKALMDATGGQHETNVSLHLADIDRQIAAAQAIQQQHDPDDEHAIGVWFESSKHLAHFAVHGYHRTDRITDADARLLADAPLPELPAPDGQNQHPNDPAMLALRTGRQLTTAGVNAGAFNEGGGWQPIRKLMPYAETQIRSLGRQLFEQYTTLPLEDIRAAAAPISGRSEVNALINWLRSGAEDGSAQIKAARQRIDVPDMPGYQPEVEVLARDGTDYMVVEDHAGAYVYAWPSQAPVVDLMARLETLREQNTVPAIEAADDPMDMDLEDASGFGP